MPSSIYDHPAWRKRPDQLMRPGGLTVTEQALAYCDLQPGMCVLDVGCGTGKSLRQIADNHRLAGIGIDTSPNLIRQAREANASLRFAQAKGQILPFATQSIDLLLSECTLSMFRMEQALSEYTRVLKQRGFLVINDVYARKEEGALFLRELPPESCIGGAMPEREILESIRTCGLRLIVFQDCSAHLKEFPICNLSNASGLSSLDLFLAASKAKLGYYFLVAKKVCSE